jgi:voltage-gated potassium channel
MSEPSPAEILPPPARPSRIGNFRSSAAQFLGALILMLFAAPFVDEFTYGKAVDIFLITLVLIMGILAVGRSRRSLIVALVLASPAVLTRWVGIFQPHWLPLALHSLFALVFIAFVEFQLLHFIFRAPRVNSEVLCAGISGYLLLGVMWMSAYMVVSLLHPVDPLHLDPNPPFAFTVGVTTPHSLSQFEAYYFSFITLSTVGYGDITPLSNGARTLAMTEAMTGMLYMAVLISRLVAMYTSQASGPTEKKDSTDGK